MRFEGRVSAGGNVSLLMSKPVRLEDGGSWEPRSMSQLPVPVPMSTMQGEAIVERCEDMWSGSRVPR